MDYLTAIGEKYNIREATLAEWDKAMELAFRVFLKFESHEYGRKGTEEFARFVTDPALKELFKQGLYKLLLAITGNNQIIGLISLRNGNHISLLFVDKEYHNQGVGTALLREIISHVRNNTIHDSITVNAAPYGTRFYHSRGFRDTDNKQVKDDIIFTPMLLRI